MIKQFSYLLEPFSLPFFVLIHLISIKNAKNISKSSFLMNVILLCLFAIGITAGYHRLYTHQSYEAPFLIRMVFLILGTGALQKDAIDWCSLHRMHHRYENKKKSLDPYGIQKFCNNKCNKICRKSHMILNFLHAHFLWLFVDRSPKFKKTQKSIIEQMKNYEWKTDYSILLLQKKYFPFLAIFIGLVIPILISKKIFKDSWSSAIGSSTLRAIIGWHITFSINSFAHLFGERNDINLTAANSHLCAILAMGEGYHNYHHRYPKDYYASEKLLCFNLTAWVLRSLKFVGLIQNTRRGVLEKPGKYEIRS